MDNKFQVKPKDLGLWRFLMQANQTFDEVWHGNATIQLPNGKTVYWPVHMLAAHSMQHVRFRIDGVNITVSVRRFTQALIERDTSDMKVDESIKEAIRENGKAQQLEQLQNLPFIDLSIDATVSLLNVVAQAEFPPRQWIKFALQSVVSFFAAMRPLRFSAHMGSSTEAKTDGVPSGGGADFGPDQTPEEAPPSGPTCSVFNIEQTEDGQALPLGSTMKQLNKCHYNIDSDIKDAPWQTLEQFDIRKYAIDGDEAFNASTDVKIQGSGQRYFLRIKDAETKARLEQAIKDVNFNKQTETASMTGAEVKEYLQSHKSGDAAWERINHHTEIDPIKDDENYIIRHKPHTSDTQYQNIRYLNSGDRYVEIHNTKS